MLGCKDCVPCDPLLAWLHVLPLPLDGATDHLPDNLHRELRVKLHGEAAVAQRKCLVPPPGTAAQVDCAGRRSKHLSVGLECLKLRGQRSRPEDILCES